MTVETTALERVLSRAGEDATGVVLGALYRIANGVFNQSQEIVPFELGVLQSSGQVIPRKTATRAEVAITYGGAAAAYAYIQHENTRFTHAPGRSSHYLSDPLERIEPMFDSILAGIVSRELFG